MYLIVKLIPNTDSKLFIDQVINSIEKESHSSNPTFKTWKITNFKKIDRIHDNIVECSALQQKDTQLESIGMLYPYPSGNDKIRFDFMNAVNINPEVDQVAMYFARCISMLRNHFGNHIESIELLGF